MKTDAIKSVLGSYGFTHDVSEAVSELFALEESHADMARALLAVLEYDRNVREFPDAAAKHPMEQVEAALRKAGVL